MPWIVGLDEAGYGPNLGPFVMSLVAFRVPEPLAGANLWTALAAAVRQDGAEDGRIHVNDSKAVHSSGSGLLVLERENGVASFIRRRWPADKTNPRPIAPTSLHNSP